MVFFMPALRAAAPPAGIESGANVIEFGSKPAFVLPLPVIFTSVTGPVGVAGAVPAGGAGGAACVWVWFWSPLLPPQASAPKATTVVSRAKRIAEVLRDMWSRAWELMSFVNSFTIAVNIEAGPQNGRPTK